MKIRMTLAVLIAGSITLTGCSGAIKTTTQPTSTPPSQGVNHPSETPTTEEPTPSPSPTEQAPKKFGQKFTYEDGLVVKVAAPTRFTPSEYSAHDKAAVYLAFQITVINGTKKNYDPTAFQTSVQSYNTEASSVFVSENGLNGAPSTKILPGRETTFKVGFGVQNPKDLVVEVTPGYEYESSIFTS